MKAISPLRYVGGKTRLLPVLYEYLPKTCVNYFEPFVGGGALFFDYGYAADHAYLNDINKPLIDTYHLLSSRYQAVETILKNEMAFQSYENIKAWFNSNKNGPRTDKLAAAFIALNHLCFNGLYRENKQGQFNVPIGRNGNGVDRSLATLDYESIERCADRLANAEFTCGSFDPWPFHKIPDKGDVVFYDPAYLQEFSSYNEAGFGIGEHKKLAEQAILHAESGAAVIVCGSNNKVSREVYGPPTKVVKLARTVGASNRKTAEECLWVWNAKGLT